MDAAAGPGTHKGPSTPNRPPCHYISYGLSPRPCGLPRRRLGWGGVPQHVVARGGWVDVGGPCGCQASHRSYCCVQGKLADRDGASRVYSDAGGAGQVCCIGGSADEMATGVKVKAGTLANHIYSN